MGISVTGGYVYRGKHEPWQGKYIFGDWSKSFAERDGQIFIATKDNDGKWTMNLATTNIEGGTNPYILAFAQDADGEVYALTSITTGPVGSLDTIYRIVPADDAVAGTTAPVLPTETASAEENPEAEASEEISEGAAATEQGTSGAAGTEDTGAAAGTGQGTNQ